MKKRPASCSPSRQDRNPNLFDLERLCHVCDRETTLEQYTTDGWKRICHTCLSERGGTYKEDKA